MKIITCTGYLGTGSSAVTDFFSEFSSCSSIGNYEIRFIHEPNGIRDLEYNLIENNHRHNTSHAIKQFKKYTKHLNGNLFRKGYKKYFGDNFDKYTNEYIKNITELCCDSWWNYDQITRGEVFTDIDILYRKFCRIFDKDRLTSILKLIHEKGYYTAISEKEFLNYTKEYIENVISSANVKKSEYIMVDQLVPPSNVNQYIHYFEDIKIFVVDRDPRDCYLFDAEKWHSGVTPVKNIEEFCDWYEIIRRDSRGKKFDENRVMRIQFEDLIYKYDETTKKMMDFVGVSKKEHINKFKNFNPEISIKNTNLKYNYPKRIKEIEYIENKLEEYLYNFK